MIHNNEQALFLLGLPRGWTRELSGRNMRITIVGLGLFLGLIWYPLISVYEIDDAYITYCYARNLAAGRGYSFNPGEYVEGATSPLWTFLLALLSFGGFSLPFYARLFSSVCGVIATLLIVLISKKINNRHHPALVDFMPALLLNVFPSLPFWTGSGMETSLYATILLCAVWMRIRLQRVWTGVFLAALILVRPEAPLIVACFALESLTETRSFFRAIGLVIPAIFTFIVQLMFRLWYFGEFMPNTYYAKTGAGFWGQLMGGIDYNQQFVRTFLPSILPNTDWASLIEVLLCFAPAVFALILPQYRIIGLLVLANLAAVTLEGGDWMPGWRFWLPVLPLMYLLITYLAPRLVGWIVPLRIKALVWPFTVLLFFIFNLLLIYIDRFSVKGVLNPAKETRPVYTAVAKLLADYTRLDATTALMDVGRVAFESNRATIDISGLTDRFIAHAPGGFLDKRYPIDYILKRDPTYVFIRPQFSIDRRIVADENFKHNYLREGNVILNHFDAPELAVLDIYRRRGRYTSEHNAALARLIEKFGFDKLNT